MTLSSSNLLHNLSQPSSPNPHRDSFDLFSKVSPSKEPSSQSPQPQLQTPGSVCKQTLNQYQYQYQYQYYDSPPPSSVWSLLEKHSSDYTSLSPSNSFNPLSPVPLKKNMPRRPSVYTFTAALIVAIIFCYLVFAPHDSAHSITKSSDSREADRSPAQLKDIDQYDPIDALGKSSGPSQETVMGAPIMGAMTNETIRAEVGRASWKLFHTILTKYPQKPTPHERETLSSYIHLFSRVYPWYVFC